MLNIVTVHWQSPRWIGPQLDYLARNIDVDYRIFASLNGIDDQSLRSRFHWSEDLDGTHAEKLNALAEVATASSEPSDLLLFLDGDAFPVRPVGTWIGQLLDSAPLAAVRRDENLGDRQPHPCFAVTTCRFWKELGGDWREGGTWVNSTGEITTDVGGTLLHQLADGGHRWTPLLRSNTADPDPLWFGVYDHRVYHHGAGFRPPVSRLGLHAEAAGRPQTASEWGTSLEGLAKRAVRQPALITQLPSHLPAVGRAARVTVGKQQRRRLDRREERRLRQAEIRQQEVYARLIDDPQFFLAFDATDPPPSEPVPA